MENFQFKQNEIESYEYFENDSNNLRDNDLKDFEYGVTLSRKINILKHRKKQAANDAQLLMNRIALLKKEEERGRKKISLVKTKAEEILTLREENEKRIKNYVTVIDEELEVRENLKSRHRNIDEEHEKSKFFQISKIKNSKKASAIQLKQDLKTLARIMIQEQQQYLQQKKIQHEEIKRTELAARKKKEDDKREHFRKIKEDYERKANAELMEAARAEKLVKELEMKEKEWIEKLQQTKILQEKVAETLENVLTIEYVKDDFELPQIESYNSATPKGSNQKLQIKGIMTPRLHKKDQIPFHTIKTSSKLKKQV